MHPVGVCRSVPVSVCGCVPVGICVWGWGGSTLVESTLL